MVPAADAKQSQQAMSETFLLSNIAPQVGDGFNRHYWAYLEAVRPVPVLHSKRCLVAPLLYKSLYETGPGGHRP